MGSQSLEPSVTALLLNMSEKFNLSWDAFQSNLGSSVRDLRDNQDFCDVTLAAENDQIKAHKIIISAGSPFFQKVLKRNEHGHPLLYLKGIKMSPEEYFGLHVPWPSGGFRGQSWPFFEGCE